MKTIKLTLVLLAFISSALKAQFMVDNVKEIEKVKNSTTYILMKDTAGAGAKAYKDIYKKYWTFSKIKFINYDDLDNYLDAQSSFLSFTGTHTTVSEVDAQTHLEKNGSMHTNLIHRYLELWVCKEKYLKKKKKKDLTMKDIELVARMTLHTDHKAALDFELLLTPNYDGGGHLCNWSPGMLKNQIQQFMMLLAKNQEQRSYSSSKEVEKLKKLKQQTLYVSDKVLIEFNKWTGDESKRNEESKIFEDYKYKYKLLSEKELSDKILNDKDGFYYLIYIRSTTDKYVNIVDSKTGELIYDKYKPMSYNFKASDMEDVFEATK